MSDHGREGKTRGLRRSLGKFFRRRLFHIRETPFLNIEDNTKTAHSAKKDKGSGPPGPSPSPAPDDVRDSPLRRSFI